MFDIWKDRRIVLDMDNDFIKNLCFSERYKLRNFLVDEINDSVEATVWGVQLKTGKLCESKFKIWDLMRLNMTKFKTIMVKAKKDGEMNTGEPFCKKGVIYEAKQYSDGDFLIGMHNMGAKFFNEYYEVVVE